MNNFLKKVIAQSPDDLQIISAILTLAPELQAEIICNPSWSLAIIFAKYLFTT